MKSRGEKSRREDEKRDRRKQIQVREMLGKSRNRQTDRQPARQICFLVVFHSAHIVLLRFGDVIGCDE